MWTAIEAKPAVQCEAHHLLRWGNAPAATIKQRGTHWECSLLYVTGCDRTTQTLPLRATLDDAKKFCEDGLVAMGWKNPSERGEQP